MAALRRAFLAVVPPPNVLDAIDGLFDRAGRSKFRWTRRDQWHVTVQYFGKVASAEDLVGALAGPLANVAAPTVQISGAGGFPSARRAAVFWLGVRDPAPLQAVHDVVIDAASVFLRPRDVIPYVPHLTLARLDPPKRMLRRIVELGIKVSIDTDAHATHQLGWHAYGCNRAAECGVPVASVVNTWVLEDLLAWCAGHESGPRVAALA